MSFRQAVGLFLRAPPVTRSLTGTAPTKYSRFKRDERWVTSAVKATFATDQIISKVFDSTRRDGWQARGMMEPDELSHIDT